MKSILKIIFSTLKEDFNVFYYTTILLFMGLGIFINYEVFKIEPAIWRVEKKYEWLAFAFFYSYLYFFCLLLGDIFKKGNFSWINKEFLFKIFFIFSILGIVRSMTGVFNGWLVDLFSFSSAVKIFIANSLWGLSSCLFVLITLFFYYKIYDSRKYNFKNNFYGFLMPRGEQLKIYFFMAFLIPLVIISLLTQKTMRQYYPLFESNIRIVEDYLPSWLATLLWESNYAIAFIRVELVFRGFLILSLVKIIGSKAVLPMALVYCFAHFGKPIAECISSFFGGFLLGAVTLKHRSIVFGIFLHIFLALSLELFAGIMNKWNFFL